jgi:hypothetical protein
MKKLISSLILASYVLGLAPLPARAAYPTQDPPYYSTTPGAIAWQPSRVAKSKRVAFIRPSRSWTAYAAPEVLQACAANGVFAVEDMIREQGGEVHTYHTSAFEAANGSRLFRELGDYYSLVVILNPIFNGVLSQQTYINPDSTNAQLLVVGGIRSNGSGTWQADTATTRGIVDIGPPLFETASGTTFSCLVPWTSSGLGTDTIWGNNLCSGVRTSDALMSSLHTGVTSVVRVLQPIKAGNPGGAWVNTSSATADSNRAKMPGAVDGFPKLSAGTPDSVAREYEYLGPIWKVKYNTGREVWWYKFNNGAGGGTYNAPLLYATIARFVDLKPIRWALDFDDVTDVNDSNNFPRWTNDAAERALAALRAVGVVPSNGINPTNAPGYIGGTTPAGESGVAWSGAAHTYLKKLNWIHHAHDSTNGSIGSNLVGGYGGYNPSNGAYPNGNFQSGSRYASRYQPGTSYGWTNFGIVQRMAYNDSVRKAWSPMSESPPYLTFPANQMLPVNWKTRGAAAGYTVPYTVTSADCPVDSVLWAFDYGLLGGQTTGKGQIWLRSGVVTTMRREAMWADRDSFVACQIGMYPRDRWTVRMNSGRLIEANIIHSFIQGISAAPRASYAADCNFKAGWVLGINNRAWRSERHRPQFGETGSGVGTNDADKGAIMNFTTGVVDFPARQSTRIVYLHPGQRSTAITSSGDLHVDVFLRGIHSYIRALDKIAGTKVSVCVPAWTVYAKK